MEQQLLEAEAGRLFSHISDVFYVKSHYDTFATMDKISLYSQAQLDLLYSQAQLDLERTSLHTPKTLIRGVATLIYSLTVIRGCKLNITKRRITE
jgi:hypothetical protein